MNAVLGLILRGVLAISIIAAGLVVGAQLRASREQLATGQAASAASATPSAVPTGTPAGKPAQPSQSGPTATKAVRTVVPTPIATPYTGPLSTVSGTITSGGKPVRGAQVMVYSSNAFNQGPTPMPPESGRAMSDDRGHYEVAVPPGTYRIGAFRAYYGPLDLGDGFTAIAWYGGGYAIGLGKDLVVNGNFSGADIAMLRQLTLAGRVIGRDGVGVPNAQVSVSRMFGGIQFSIGGGTTDDTGRFSFPSVAMAMTLIAVAPGRTNPVSTTVELDLRADRTDLIVTIDRGNIVSGTLRDAAGRPLANTGFGVVPTDDQFICGWCNGQSDASGRFTTTLPSTTVRFRNWARSASDADLLSPEYVISGDMTLDPVLKTR